MHCTVEKMSSLQRLQITLWSGDGAASGAAAPAETRVALDSSYPYKPILRIQQEAPASSAAATAFAVPLSARVDLADASNRLSQTDDATVISIRMKADLAEAEGEDDFPTARELVASEYAHVYCRHCGTAVFAPRDGAVFSVLPLPSPYWAELTDLWFCHTSDNAHIDRIAATQITAQRGRILVDKLMLRVHREDLNAPDTWKTQASVHKLIQGLRESQAAAMTDAASSADAAATPAAAASSSIAAASPSPPLASRDVWSPLPCSSCPAVLGSILLNLSPSAQEHAAVRPSPVNPEVRLFKYQLSNCFRKKDAAKQERKDAEDSADMTDAAAAAPASSVASTSASSAAAAASSSPAAPSPSCLCFSYVPSPLLTCSNMHAFYNFETFVCEDLTQRFAKQPVGKFLVENIVDETAPNEQRIFLRLFVSQWDLPLSSNITSAFPFTPRFSESNVMLSVIKLEFAAHAGEDDAALQTWIHGKRKASPSAAFPSNVDRIAYSTADCRALLELLQTRSGVLPPSLRRSPLDPAMLKSCLVKISKRLRP